MKRFAVIDFETTGLRAGTDRIIEVGAAVVSDGEVVATFSQLMNPGFRIPAFITHLTGISDAMVRDSPCPEMVMPQLRAFLGDHICIAHNASFDQRFYTAEMAFAKECHERTFVCSMLLARRLVHDSPSHKLGVLVRHLQLSTPPGLHAHRALADVLMTCSLWKQLTCMLRTRLNGRVPDLEILQALMRKPKNAIDAYFASFGAGEGQAQAAS